MAKKPAKEAVELAAPEEKKQTQKKPGKTSGKAPAKKPNVEKNGKNFQAKPEETKKRSYKQLPPADWRKIRMDYVKGKMTHAKIAEKYHVSVNTIYKRASLEGWTKKRKKLDRKVEEKTFERVAEARARELEKLAAIQEKVDDFLDAAVAAIGQVPLKKYDEMRGIESLTKAIQIAVQTKRDLYNIPNEADRAKIESLREKARLDRQRYEDEKAEKAKMAQAAADTMIRVVIEGEGGALDE